jgi:short-subunit dehydrogenase
MSLPPPSLEATVLITGASSGIGAELARQLGARGYNVTLVARRQDRLAELAELLRARHGVVAEVHTCDLADASARGELIAAVAAGEHHVAGLCNNAGFGSFGQFWELPYDRELREVRLNIEALHELTGHFLPKMVERGAGAVLNTSSLASFQPQPLNATYAATKAFVTSFSEALHAELAGTGVSCTALCPGPVRTEFAAVAGISHLDGSGGPLIWATAQDCARVGIEGMIKGRRIVMPRLPDQVIASAGRFAPRSVLLPIMRTISRRGLGTGN